MTTIVDSSARPENSDQLDYEIQKADVICIIYAADDPSTFERITDYWLPHIRFMGRNVPVVLVRNKVDLLKSAGPEADNVSRQQLEKQISSIMEEYKEVETLVDTSALKPLNVYEAFYFAQKAVLHPTAPLYDSRQHLLKPACEAALRRIVKLCDTNKDGVLDDEELNEFQRRCFKEPLQQQELEGIKEIVRENEPNGLRDKALTAEGFLHLHYAFLQKGRSETTWTVLRKFGYGDDLSLSENFLHPKLDVPQDSSVELSAEGYDFFTHLFTIFDKDKDGALNESELNDLFSTAPCNPWLKGGTLPQNTTLTDEHGSLTLQGFLALWSMTTLLRHQTTLEYLAYLGFNLYDKASRSLPGPAPSLQHSFSNISSTSSLISAGLPDMVGTGVSTTVALRVTKPRRFDRLRGRKVQKNVLLCYVFGATGSGKTSLLRGFIGKTFSDAYLPTTKTQTVVNSIDANGAEKYLVLQEFGAKQDHEWLEDKAKMEAADVLMLVYDSSDVNSFAYVEMLRRQHDLEMYPCVFVATKSDLDTVHQRCEIQPDQYCRQLQVPVPIAVSVRDGQLADLFRTLVRVAINPTPVIPALLRSKDHAAKYFFMRTNSLLGIAGVITAAALAYLIFKK